METNVNKNQRVLLVEQTFGIKLPELKIYKSNRKIVSEPKEENGVSYPGKWEYEDNPRIPIEWEIYLPKEEMSTQQALKQLQACYSLVSPGCLYDQTIKMQFMQNAILNCIYIASTKINDWKEKAERGFTSLELLSFEMSNFHDAFINQKANLYFYENYLCRAYLRLLLESDVKLHYDEMRKKNELFDLLFSIFKRQIGDGDIQKYVVETLKQKCNDLVLSF